MKKNKQTKPSVNYLDKTEDQGDKGAEPEIKENLNKYNTAVPPTPP